MQVPNRSRFTVALVPILAAAAATAASRETPRRAEVPVDVESALVFELQLHGIGELRFGPRLEWKLVTEPPAETRAGPGVPQGTVWIRSVDGTVRHQLTEPPAFSYAENGPSCRVLRVDHHALIRCNRDYIFDLQTAAAPVLLSPQFSDRSGNAPEWLDALPLPWWRLAGVSIPRTSLTFLEYGYVNYGQNVESTELYRGPALLDLDTGKIAFARAGAGADAPLYDASGVATDEAIAVRPERVVADSIVDGRRIVTVVTVFDRCVSATCIGDARPEFVRREPLTYVFE